MFVMCGIFAIYKWGIRFKEMFYIHKDYLGSFETVTIGSGEVYEKLSFDPCLPVRNEMRAGGRRRNPTNWTYEFTSMESTYLFDWGFTGHCLSRHVVVGKHLDNFDLINMNGRMYDPWLGRFLSPDPFVQAPTYSQNFNRYSYAWNNPLKYTDPDGEWVNFVLGAVVGGISGYIAGDMAGATGWDLVAYIGVGAGAGAATAGIGSGVSSALTSVGLEGGFIAGAITGTTAGFAGGVMTGTGFSLIEGNTFDDALMNGLNAGGIGAAVGFAMGGLIGGLDAAGSGRDFWTGGDKNYRIIKSPLKQVNGTLEDDCSYCFLESVDQSYGGTNSKEFFRNEFSEYCGFDYSGGIEVNEFNEFVNTLHNYKSEGIISNGDEIFSALSDDKRVAVAISNYGSGSESHQVGVVKMKLWDSGKYKIWTMNPDNGKYLVIKNNSHLGKRFWTIWKN